ncbi:hypothetical protein TMEN_3432 [Trichophyton mentagrophytes]|uniref:Uncharacterized protein n=1 Tax=Trichophyton interdigitale (strain MR816) TaxID=1215338 RepID=A0A059JHI2_TRIIM|nr:hypothetical protein H109_00897 [Trichophyton interdigitale MR816]GBF60964.1 hypothetical protein TMEN_3432 [Trichophyton mentagrophytes]
MAHPRLGRAFVRGCISQSTSLGRYRAFSSSASLCKALVPKFAPTSSPELDGLLQKFRDKLFIPAWLPYEDKRAMYKKSKSQELLSHPVVVNVGTEDAVDNYTLRPMHIADAPSNSDVARVIRLLKTEEDWKSLIPFLSGLHSSKRDLTPHTTEMLIRRAGDLGMEAHVLQAVAQARRTGLLMRNADFTRTLLYSIRLKAEKAGFKGPDVHFALGQAKELVRLLNSPEHTHPVAEKDPKRLPSVIGMLLELKAAYAMDAFKGRDEDQGVRSYANKLISTWPLEKFTVPSEWPTANWRLRTYVPLWHGMDLALKVEEIKAQPDIRQGLEARRDELAKAIESCLQTVDKHRQEVTHTVSWTKSLLHK